MIKIPFVVLSFLLFFAFAAHASVTTFVYPDDTDVIDNFVGDATNLNIAVYTYDDAQLSEHFRPNANITLLVEKSPAGGMSNKWILCDLQRNGVHVFLYDGSLRFMHAKYMIKGNSVLVSTENIGSNNRGWGAITNDTIAISEFKSIFEKDLAASQQLQCNSTEQRELARKEHAAHFSAATFNGNVTAIFVPGAEQTIISLLDSAKQSIYVQQFYIYKNWTSKKAVNDSENPFLKKIIEKALQGIEVKILLDSTYYNKDSNGEVIDYINTIAKENNIKNMEARYIKNTYFEKSHAKGVIVDDRVLISSINWNDNSVRNNREAGLLISGDAAQYFKNVFLADWNSDYNVPKTGAVTMDYSLILGIVVLIIIVCIVAYFLWKRKQK